MGLLDVDLFTTKVAGEVFSFSRDVATQHDLLRNENENCLNNLSKENDYFAFECAPLFVGNQSLEDTLNTHILPVVTKTCMKVLEQGVPEQVILGVLKDFFKEKRLLNIAPHTEVCSEKDSLMDVLSATTHELANWKPLFKRTTPEEAQGVFLWQDLDHAKVNMKIRYGQLLEERRRWAKKQREALTHEEDNAAEEKKDDADIARNTLYRLHLARCLRSSFTQDALEASLLPFVNDVCETLEDLACSPNPSLAGLCIHYKKEYEALRKEQPSLVPQVYSSFFEDAITSSCMDEVSCWAFRRIALPYLLLTSEVEQLIPDKLPSDMPERVYALPLCELVLRWDKAPEDVSDWDKVFKDNLYVCNTNIQTILQEHQDSVKTPTPDDTKETCMMISDMVLDRVLKELGTSLCMYQYDADNCVHKTKLAHLKMFGHDFKAFMGMYGGNLSFLLFEKTQEYLASYPKEQVWEVYKRNVPLFIEACKKDISCEKILEDDGEFLKTPLMDFFQNNDRKLALLAQYQKPSLFKHR